MTTDQAKEILVLHRPGIDDPNEPEVAAALAHAADDPQLGAWWKQHAAAQGALRNKFKQIQVPPHLRGAISMHPAPSRQWWRSPVVWAAAAAIVLLLVLVSNQYLRSRNPSFAAYRSRMVRTAMGNYQMPFMTNDLAAIRSYLAANKGHGDYVLPAKLSAMPGEGCVIDEFHSRTFSLICLDGGQGRDVFLFVIDRSVLSDPPRAAPEIINVGRHPTASWSQGNKAYILTTKGDEAFLRSIL